MTASEIKKIANRHTAISENFVYWIQGMLESTNLKTLDEAQVQSIKDHLSLVLKKETPIREQTSIIRPILTPSQNPYTGINPDDGMPQIYC